MNEKILKTLYEMDAFMPGGSLLGFLYEHKKMIRFQLLLSKSDLEKDIEELDLSVRSIHCLRRAGFTTIGSLALAIEAKEDNSSKSQLLKIRSLGRKSAEEILLLLFCYQLRCMPEREKKEYLKELVRVNA